MRICFVLFLLPVAAFAQDVHLYGRVYDSKNKSASLAGVTVTVTVGGVQVQKLTGTDGTYTFTGLKRGDAVVKFEKAKWQPDPRTDNLSLNSASVPYDVDLFQANGDADVLATINNKINLLKAELGTNSDTVYQKAALASQWQTCQQAEIAAHLKVVCAAGLLAASPQGISLPKDIDAWAKVDRQELNQVEDKLKVPATSVPGEIDLKGITAYALPPEVVYSQIQYELSKSGASDAAKAITKSAATEALHLDINKIE